MRITFMGAVREVTGSMHVVEANGSRILLDCGMFQGRRRESFERNRDLPVSAREIDAVILSHAHIDHSGSIPTLVREGFAGNVYSTPATRDLCSAMLLDSAYIHQKDAEYLQAKGVPAVEPIYTVADAVASLRHFVSVGYGRWFDVAPGVRAAFRDAGHILGSAITVLEITEGAAVRRLGYTGDLGRRNLPILRDPEPLEDVDWLMIESTYGGHLHQTPAEAEGELGETIRRAHDRGGKVIIPAFAVGRTQEVVYDLHRLHTAGRIPDVPVFVDSPLAVNVTEIFRLHPECYDEEITAFMLNDDDHDPFGFGKLRYVREAEASKGLNSFQGPCVIISASGMCEAGRILHHLKHNVEDPRSTILIVGFQAEHTLGRRIVERRPRLKILGGEYELKANVKVIDGYSAHADRRELIDYVATMKRPPGATFVIHGEESESLELAAGLREMGLEGVEVPSPMEAVEL